LIFALTAATRSPCDIFSQLVKLEFDSAIESKEPELADEDDHIHVDLTEPEFEFTLLAVQTHALATAYLLV